MQIDFLRKHFENHRWATSFEHNDYIMAPPLFNNIYRGALGEVVGKALFYRYVNVQLEDITENKIFEFFDYKVPGAVVYVDFKNWHETSNFDDEQMTAHSRLNDLMIFAENNLFRVLYVHDDFAQKISNTRNYLTHYDAKKEATALKGEDLSKAIYLLELILEYYVCLEFGIDRETYIRNELMQVFL